MLRTVSGTVCYYHHLPPRENEKNGSILKHNPVRVFLQASGFVAEEMDSEYAQGHLHSKVQQKNQNQYEYLSCTEPMAGEHGAGQAVGGLGTWESQG